MFDLKIVVLYNIVCVLRGEMAELAEGGRLLSDYTG